MPRRKAPKRKIKEVVVPDGDQGQQLSAADRKAKLDSFLEQYDLQGKFGSFLQKLNFICMTLFKDKPTLHIIPYTALV